MRNNYKTTTNYNNNNTRNNPLNKRTQRFLKIEPNIFNRTNDNFIYTSINDEVDNILLSKALSKEKSRGIFDNSSPGNKDVLTDSDSEMQHKISKNMKYNNNNINKKKGCAKLIIEKVESQEPNDEYYKLNNHKKKIRYNNTLNNSDNNQLIRVNSPPSKINSSSFKKYIKYKNKIVQGRGIINLKGYQKQSKTITKNYINNRNSYLNFNHKKNFSQNTVYTTDSISKDNKNYNNMNNNYLNKKKNFSGNKYISMELNNNVNHQINRASFNYNSTGNSIEKKTNSHNIGYKNIKYKKNIKENDFTSTISNNEEIYPNKNSIGLKKKIFINNHPQKSISLYDNYTDLLKKNNTKNEKTYLQNRYNEKIIKSIIKIQSFWRGAFIRELMSFVEKLNRFINVLFKLFHNNKRRNFFYFINLIKYYEKDDNRISLGVNIKGPSVRQKIYIFNTDRNKKIIKARNNERKYNIQKGKTIIDETKYQIMIDNYNALMLKYNKLKEESNKINKQNKFYILNIDNNNYFGIIGQKNINLKNIIYRKSKIHIDDNSENKKKRFDIIQLEKKENFKIIPKGNNYENLKYRGRKPINKSIQKIQKVSEIIFENKKYNKLFNYEDYLNHFISNIKIINNDKLIIEKVSQIKKELDNIKNNYEQYLKHFISNINIISNDKFIIESNANINDEKIFNYEKYLKHFISNINIINRDKFIIQESSENNKKNEKLINYEDYLNHFNSNISIINKDRFIIDNKPNFNKKIIPFEISNNCLTLINKNNKNLNEEKQIKYKKFDNISFERNRDSEITIITHELKELKSESEENHKEKILEQKKQDLIKECQNNLNFEIKGFENQKFKKYKDCLVKEHINNINIIQIKKQNSFDKEHINTKNNTILSILSNKADKKEIDNKNKNNIKNIFNIHSLIINKKINLKIISDNKVEFNKDKNINNNTKINEFIIEKKEDISFIEINKNKKYDKKLIMDNNNILYVKKIKKNKCDKITEITEDLNKLEINNHYELSLKGMINLNKNSDSNIIKNKSEYLDNNKKEINKQKIELSFIPIYKNKKNNFNEENKFEKGNLINKNKELKKNNIIISSENQFEFLYNKNKAFTEKAKRNILKIILPIKLKIILREYIKVKIFPILIKKMKIKK